MCRFEDGLTGSIEEGLTILIWLQRTKRRYTAVYPPGVTCQKPTGDGEWSRYVTYSVVASLRERIISYRATFLFSKNGKEVLPLDYATAMGIAAFVSVPMYPYAIVDTAVRELPFVESWILSNEVAGCKQFKEPEVCCDRITATCGLSSEDLQLSLSKTIDPDMRSFLHSKSPKKQK